VRSHRQCPGCADLQNRGEPGSNRRFGTAVEDNCARRTSEGPLTTTPNLPGRPTNELTAPVLSKRVRRISSPALTKRSPRDASSPAPLIPVLQIAQGLFGYLPEIAAQAHL